MADLIFIGFLVAVVGVMIWLGRCSLFHRAHWEVQPFGFTGVRWRCKKCGNRGVETD